MVRLTAGLNTYPRPQRAMVDQVQAVEAEVTTQAIRVIQAAEVEADTEATPPSLQDGGQTMQFGASDEI